MANRKVFWKMSAMLLALVFTCMAMTGCAFILGTLIAGSAPKPDPTFDTPSDAAQFYGLVLNENESVVVLRRITGTGSAARMGEPKEWQVFINGELSKTIGKHKTIAFILPNGTHKIYVYMGKGADKVAKSEEITLNAQSNLFRLETEIIGGAANQQVILRQM